MAFQKFLIGGPFKTGLERDRKPWLLAEEAFETIRNAYVWRGRVRKRFGSVLLNKTVPYNQAQLYSRLRIALPGGAAIGITDGAGNANGTVPGIIFKPGQLFSIDTTLYTVPIAGAPIALLSTGIGTGTFDTTNGNYTFIGSTPGTQIYFYPAEPVMGFANYEQSDINKEPTIAFDTQFSYQYVVNQWTLMPNGVAPWTGTNSDFFWSTNYRGSTSDVALLFTSNNVTFDGLRYWDGNIWLLFAPLINGAGDFIETARLVIPYKDRLLLFNTVENIGGNIKTFSNRVRFSQNGSPLDIDAYREDIPGRGGYLTNTSTKEAIVSAEFIKDRLIVFFERSTWELVYTGNEILPFRWQQINTELGAESTFSIVPFDKIVLGIANVGIHACNGANVERIDDKIPDEVFKIHNDDEGVFRVHGIRDYYTELVYWTFPGLVANPPGATTYPSRVLVFNYRDGSWSFLDDSITAFGYFQNISTLRWIDIKEQWQSYHHQWNAASQQSQFRHVICGNQQGFTFIADSETSRNAPALQISDITLGGYPFIGLTVYDHNLKVGDFILIENVVGMAGVNNEILEITVLLGTDVVVCKAPQAVGVYLGGGTVARVTPPEIITKEYNFFANQNRNMYISQVNFLIDKTTNGQMNISYYPSFSNLDIAEQSLPVTGTGSNVGTNTLQTSPYALVPLENQQAQLWHPMYTQAEGETIQLRIYLDLETLIDNRNTGTLTAALLQSIAESNFELHAMLFYGMPTRYVLE